MPHTTSLHRWVSSFFISSGIPNSLFYVLEQKIKSLAFKDRIWILCLDEMCLKTVITYDRRFNVLVGYENLWKKPSKPVRSDRNIMEIAVIRSHIYIYIYIYIYICIYIYMCLWKRIPAVPGWSGNTTRPLAPEFLLYLSHWPPRSSRQS